MSSAAACTSPRTGPGARKGFKKVGEVFITETTGELLIRPSLRTSAILLLLSCLFKLFSIFPVLAILIIFFPFFRIAEHLICFIDLLELEVGFLVVRIQVRMVLPGKFAVRFFNFFLCCILVKTKYFIVIYVCHNDFLKGKLIP